MGVLPTELPGFFKFMVMGGLPWKASNKATTAGALAEERTATICLGSAG